jgi:hypothetical protein
MHDRKAEGEKKAENNLFDVTFLWTEIAYENSILNFLRFHSSHVKKLRTRKWKQCQYPTFQELIQERCFTKQTQDKIGRRQTPRKERKHEGKQLGP